MREKHIKHSRLWEKLCFGACSVLVISHIWETKAVRKEFPQSSCPVEPSRIVFGSLQSLTWRAIFRLLQMSFSFSVLCISVEKQNELCSMQLCILWNLGGLVYVACLVVLCIAAMSSFLVCYYWKSFSGTPQHVFHIHVLISGITGKSLQEVSFVCCSALEGSQLIKSKLNSYFTSFLQGCRLEMTDVFFLWFLPMQVVLTTMKIAVFGFFNRTWV